MRAFSVARLRGVTAFIGACLCMVLPLTAAASASAEPMLADVGSSKTLTESELESDEAQLDETSVSQIAAAPSPANCTAKANNPHSSTSQQTWGWVKGYGTITCNYAVSELELKPTVWQSRWWGYQQMGDPEYGHVIVSNSSFIGRSGMWKGCTNNKWRTVVNAASVEGGQIYYAEVMAYADVVCK